MSKKVDFGGARIQFLILLSRIVSVEKVYIEKEQRKISQVACKLDFLIQTYLLYDSGFQLLWDKKSKMSFLNTVFSTSNNWISTHLIVLHVGNRNRTNIAKKFRLELLFYWVLAVDLKVLRTGTPASRQLSDIRAVHVAYLPYFFTKR